MTYCTYHLIHETRQKTRRTTNLCQKIRKNLNLKKENKEEVCIRDSNVDKKKKKQIHNSQHTFYLFFNVMCYVYY